MMFAALLITLPTRAYSSNRTGGKAAAVSSSSHKSDGGDEQLAVAEKEAYIAEDQERSEGYSDLRGGASATSGTTLRDGVDLGPPESGSQRRKIS